MVFVKTSWLPFIHTLKACGKINMKTYSGASQRRWPEPLLLTSHGHHDITSADYTLGTTIYIYIYTEKRRVGWFATLCTAAPILPHPSGARLHRTQSTVPNFINTFKNSSLVKKGDVVGVRLVLIFILFFFLAIQYWSFRLKVQYQGGVPLNSTGKINSGNDILKTFIPVRGVQFQLSGFELPQWCNLKG